IMLATLPVNPNLIKATPGDQKKTPNGSDVFKYHNIFNYDEFMSSMPWDSFSVNRYFNLYNEFKETMM
ncbi:hypothetical protein WA026_014459, partial [Henosepilachna vigintioctopunctata]